MDIINQFLNQSCLWFKSSGQVDQWGKPIELPPLSIRCRFTLKNATASGLMGKETADMSRVIAKEEINIGDYLEYESTRYVVERISEPRWIGGEYIGRFIGVRRDEGGS